MKNKLNHYGHALTSLDELEAIFKRNHSIFTIKEKKELHFNGIHTFYNSIDFAYFEIISNKAYWFRIQKPLKEFNKDKKSKPIGWIFRRTLDYVSLDYVNGDWSRKFLWSCEITSSDQMKKRLKNEIDKLIKSSGNKIKEFN